MKLRGAGHCAVLKTAEKCSNHLRGLVITIKIIILFLAYKTNALGLSYIVV